jgi:hypothetical protein
MFSRNRMAFWTHMYEKRSRCHGVKSKVNDREVKAALAFLLQHEVAMHLNPSAAPRLFQPMRGHPWVGNLLARGRIAPQMCLAPCRLQPFSRDNQSTWNRPIVNRPCEAHIHLPVLPMSGYHWFVMMGLQSDRAVKTSHKGTSSWDAVVMGLSQ